MRILRPPQQNSASTYARSIYKETRLFAQTPKQSARPANLRWPETPVAVGGDVGLWSYRRRVPSLPASVHREMSGQAIQLYIVDDEPSVCTAYARLARSAKMESRTFESVQEFMQAEVSDENACLICDVRMPGTSGLELPELLARAGRHLPVIFVTAHDTEETRAVAQRVGAAAYFRKPVDDQALLDAIAWALSGRAGTTDRNR